MGDYLLYIYLYRVYLYKDFPHEKKVMMENINKRLFFYTFFFINCRLKTWRKETMTPSHYDNHQYWLLKVLFKGPTNFHKKKKTYNVFSYKNVCFSSIG